ncbi:hypothetical protein BURCENBC7_AP5364, partial [Burkholderia cenocepacia BC7]|uniref:hypothetical protein n=1 Tax=Burkholderia cenocepacia TaxID=95486 RepID=UPI0002AC0EF0
MTAIGEAGCGGVRPTILAGTAGRAAPFDTAQSHVVSNVRPRAVRVRLCAGLARRAGIRRRTS